MSRVPLLALALLIAVAVLPSPSAATSSFTDIAGSPFRADIEWLAARGVTGGCDTGRYCPKDVVTRGQMASLLVRMFGVPNTTRDYFHDDNASMHESAINRLAAAGVTGGCATGMFCPNARLNRQQMASLLARVMGLHEGSGTNYFYDDNGSAHEANINRIARGGIAAGCGAGRYCPHSAITRGEMAAFLHRTVSPISPPEPHGTPPAGARSTSGIVGYGSATKGGAGGKVLAVTNLNESGPGSLRAAAEASGARVVVFKVGGVITLATDLKISDPFVTIAGETAPSPIVIRGAGTVVRTHEVIVRHLRFRPGDLVDAPSDADALTLNGMRSPVHNVVLDHLTMVWGPDIGGLAVLGDVRAVTVSNSIMGEGLYLSRHAEGTTVEGGHSHAANLTQLDGASVWPRQITFARNLFTTSDTRIPRLQGAECVDIVNNVIYNWGTHAAHGNARSVNLVNNWYRKGPEFATTELWSLQTSSVVPNAFGSSVYEAGNRADGFTGTRGGPSLVYASGTRCGGLSLSATTPDAAYGSVLANAGATLPSRDGVDARIITNVKNRAGSFVNGADHPGPNPYWP